MAYDPENPFPGMDKSDPETIEKYFEDEKFHVLPESYSKPFEANEYRGMSIKFIKQLGGAFCNEGHAIVPYLALTIFDNFVSSCKPPEKLKRKRNHIGIFVSCCFAFVCRMIQPQFSLRGDKIKANLNVSVGEMVEFITEIEESLKARNCMPPVTSLCFLDHLIGLLTELDKPQMKCLKSFATHQLYALKYDMRLAEFQPSIVAAAALASSVNTLYDKKLGYVINKFLHCEHLNKESLKRSVEMLIPDVTVCLTTIKELTELSELTINKFLELLHVTHPDCFDDSDTDTAKPASPPPDPGRSLSPSVDTSTSNC